MKKLSYSIMLPATIFILILSGCSILKGKDNTQPVVNNAQSSISSTKQNDIPKENINSNDNNNQNTSTDVNSTKAEDYTTYSGHWVTEDNYKNHYNFGTGMTVTIDNKGNISGNIGTSSNNATHVANVQFKGTLQNNKFIFKFDNDGWDHSGNIEMEFKDNKTICTITVNSSEQASIWGIQAGNYTFVKADK